MNIMTEVRTLFTTPFSTLNRPKQPLFLIHGGGNIGLGLMAEIVAKSPVNYRIVATSRETFRNNLINSLNCLWLHHAVNAENTITRIENVNMVDPRYENNMIYLYFSANMAALCLIEDAIPKVAKSIAIALIARHQAGCGLLKILVLMNKPGCDQYVRSAIYNELLLLHNDSHFAEAVLSGVEFVPTIADRIVSRIDNNVIIKQLRKQLITAIQSHSRNDVKESDLLHSKQIHTDQINHIINSPNKLTKAIRDYNLQFNMFATEKNYSLLVPENFTEASHFPSVSKVKNISKFMTLKNKFLNGPHAVIAWLGGLQGFEKVAEAVKTPMIKEFISDLMEQEIAPILCAEYPDLTPAELAMHKRSFIKRCEMNHQDTINRVGRDPLRKLNRGGCIRGLIELKTKHRLNLSTEKLEYAIAAAILYSVKGLNDANNECKKISAIYHANKSYEAVLCYNGMYGKQKYPGLNPLVDRAFINAIVEKIHILDKNNSPMSHVCSRYMAMFK